MSMSKARMFRGHLFKSPKAKTAILGGDHYYRPRLFCASNPALFKDTAPFEAPAFKTGQLF